MSDTYPDFRNPAAAVIRVRRWNTSGPDHQVSTADEVFASWEREPWPDGLLSRSTFLSTDGEAALTYEQWETGTAPPDPDAIDFRRYRSLIADDERRVTGCIAIPMLDADNEESARNWLDAIFDAVADDPEPHHPWGIAANWHLAVNGTKLMNISEWTSEEHHIQGFADQSRTNRPGWRRIRAMPGVHGATMKRFLLHRSRLRP
ncbi:hypothetical protein [Nocardia gipuzkoensis]